MAVGYTNGGPPGLVDTLSSGTWSDTTLLAPAGSTGFRLQGVSCSAVGSCEAVGYATKSSTVDQPVVETLTSGSWSASTPTLPVGALSGALYGVSCPASGTCVAVGTVTDSSDQALPLVETLAGGAWRARRTGLLGVQLAEHLAQPDVGVLEDRDLLVERQSGQAAEPRDHLVDPGVPGRRGFLAASLGGCTGGRWCPFGKKIFFIPNGRWFPLSP